MIRWYFLLLLTLAACEEVEPQKPSSSNPLAPENTTTLQLPVKEGRTFVRLDNLTVVDSSDAWDLAFEGFRIYTNGGASGTGLGSALGPYTRAEFDGPVVVPLTFKDRPGGAFLDWYLYEDAPAHVLWSRFHVFAVKDQERLWKVQILGYYGKVDGAPVAAVYHLRYAEVTANGSGPVQEVEALDASAGGPTVPVSSPSSCLDLSSNTILPLTPTEAVARSDWHLCFRRQDILVNGGLSGPRGVEAADLQATQVIEETLPQLKARTADSEQSRFLEATYDELIHAPFTTDGVQSAFSLGWLDRSVSPPAPTSSSWLVVAADGKQRFRVRFDRFEGATDLGPGTITMSVRPD